MFRRKTSNGPTPDIDEITGEERPPTSHRSTNDEADWSETDLLWDDDDAAERRRDPLRRP